MRSALLAAVLLALLGVPSPADTWDVVYVPNDAMVFDIEMEGSTIWMSTRRDGLLGHDGSSWVVHLAEDYPGDPTTGIRSNSFNYTLLVDRAGDKWIGRNQKRVVDRLTDAGTFAKGDDRWTYYSKRGSGEINEVMLNFGVWSMAEDCEGNKWFGIGGSGGDSPVELLVENDDTTTVDDEWFALRADDPAMQDSTFFSDYSVSALAVDHSCRLWIGYEQAGIDVWDYGNPRTFADDHWERYTSSNGLPNDAIKAFRVGPDGRVWIGTNGGLAVFDPADGTWQTVTGLPGIQARAIDIDARGHVWVGTDDGVAMLHSNGRVAAVHGAGSDGIAHPGIVDLAVDQSDGTVWVVSEEIAQGPTSLSVFDSGFGPPSGEIYAYPNPWRAGSAMSAINVFGAPEGSEVVVLDVTGEEVRELKPTEPYIWDTLDSSFNEVPSGLYVVRVETPDGRVTFLKVAIVR